MNRLILFVESRIRWKVYVRFGGECPKTHRSNTAGRWMLSLPITGEVWIYPEFKGYYSRFYGLKLDCPTPFEVYCASEDVFLHLFTPSIQQQYDPKRNYTFPKYPNGNISFMDAIPSVGTKFGEAENFGPQSQRHRFKEFSASPNIKNRFYFKFN